MEWDGLRAKGDSDGKINAEGENKGSTELGDGTDIGEGAEMCDELSIAQGV